MPGSMHDADSGDLLLVAANDPLALERLLGRWRDLLYAFFERAHEPSGAIDLTAETFVRLRASAGRFDPSVAFPVWLWRIAVRVLSEAPPPPVTSVPAARLRESAAARTALVRASVAGLPPSAAAALLLTRIARLTVAETAQVLDAPPSDVRRLLVDAMDRLAGALEPLLELPVSPPPVPPPPPPPLPADGTGSRA